MWIDLTCPVELWQYSLPKEDSPECAFVLNNLSDKVVASVQVALSFCGEDEKPLFKQIERAQGLNAGAGERFSMLIVPNRWEGVKSVDLVVEKVWYDDATIWRRGSASPTEYRGNALPAGRKLDQLRFIAGADAVGYPEEQENVWVCVCGRANDPRATRCCRCERTKETVFASFTPENIEQLNAVHEQKLLDVSKNAREDASRLAEEREQARQKKVRRKRALTVTLTLTLVLAIGAAAALLWGVPALRYGKAKALLEGGSYAEAKAAFAEMPGYSDADALALECDYLSAEALAAQGTREGDRQAADAFAALGDYKDSAERRLKALYALGERCLAEKSYDAAAEAFQTLGDYKDSAARMSEAIYQQGSVLYDAGSYTAAKLLFTQLNEYGDAPAQALACDRELGREALLGGEYEQAVALLTQAGDAPDAAELLREACYKLAQLRYEAGEYEQAGDLYQRAAGYEDAALKANDCLYQLAHTYMTAGDYAKAKELFDRVASYLDSETLSWECVYRQAKAAKEAGDERAAAELYETIPLHSDAAQQAQACYYALAAKATGDEAIALYEQAGSYKDAETQLKKLRYAAADAALSSGDYETAATLFEALGGYSASARKLSESRYQLALKALEEKQYDVAIEAFRALGSYSDSRKRLEEATLARAAELKEGGGTDDAEALLQSLSGSDAAQKQLDEIAFEKAVKVQESGDIEGASALFLALGSFEGARTRYCQCQYALAQKSLADGDVRGAGDRFLAIAEYEDAKAQSEACYRQLFGDVADRARAAYEKQDWQTVVDTLENVDRATLPEGYTDLAELYNASCYNYAEALYAKKDIYGALPYYERIPDYRDVRDTKLQRRCYLILGAWENAAGDRTAVFRRDGTCQVFGVDGVFRVDGYLVLTGASADRLAATHKISTLTDSALTLRDMASDVTYRLTKTAEALTEAELGDGA